VPTSFPVSERNKLRRLHERGSYDKDAAYAILDTAMICGDWLHHPQPHLGADCAGGCETVILPRE
jgi:hypothetical protein